MSRGASNPPRRSIPRTSTWPACVKLCAKLRASASRSGVPHPKARGASKRQREVESLKGTHGQSRRGIGFDKKARAAHDSAVNPRSEPGPENGLGSTAGSLFESVRKSEGPGARSEKTAPNRQHANGPGIVGKAGPLPPFPFSASRAFSRAGGLNAAAPEELSRYNVVS